MGKSDQFFPKKIFLGVPRLRAAQSWVSAKGLSSMPCHYLSSEIVLRATIVGGWRWLSLSDWYVWCSRDESWEVQGGP